MTTNDGNVGTEEVTIKVLADGEDRPGVQASINPESVTVNAVHSPPTGRDVIVTLTPEAGFAANLSVTLNYELIRLKDGSTVTSGDAEFDDISAQPTVQIPFVAPLQLIGTSSVEEKFRVKLTEVSADNPSTFDFDTGIDLTGGPDSTVTLTIKTPLWSPTPAEDFAAGIGLVELNKVDDPDNAGQKLSRISSIKGSFNRLGRQLLTIELDPDVFLNEDIDVADLYPADGFFRINFARYPVNTPGFNRDGEYRCFGSPIPREATWISRNDSASRGPFSSMNYCTFILNRSGEVRPLPAPGAPWRFDMFFTLPNSSYDASGDPAKSHYLQLFVTRKASSSPPRTGAVNASIEENETDTGEIFNATFNPSIPAANLSLAGNEDGAKFMIDAASGELKFKAEAEPDFEDPQDTGGPDGDNKYQVLVVQTPSGGTAVTASVTVAVTDAGLRYLDAGGRSRKEAADNTAEPVDQINVNLNVINDTELTDPIHLSASYSYTVTSATYSGGTPPGTAPSSVVVADGAVDPVVVTLAVATVVNLSSGKKRMTYEGSFVPSTAVKWPQPSYATKANDEDRGHGYGDLNLTLTPASSSPIELALSDSDGNSDTSGSHGIESGTPISMSGFGYSGDLEWPGTGDSALALTGTVTPPLGVHRITTTTALTQFFTETRGVVWDNGSSSFRYVGDAGNTCTMVVSALSDDNTDNTQVTTDSTETIDDCAEGIYAMADTSESRVTSSIGVIPPAWDYEWLNDRLDFGADFEHGTEFELPVQTPCVEPH